MNLVHCLTHSGAGGGQQIVFTLVKQLCQSAPAADIAVVLPSGGQYPDRFRSLGVEIFPCPLDRITGSATKMLREYFRVRKPAIVHSHGKGAGFHARRVAVPGTRFVHSYHGYHPPKGPARRFLYRRLEQYLLNRTDAVINVSASEREVVLSDFPQVGSRARVIPNLIDRLQVLADANHELPETVEPFFTRHPHAFFVMMLGRNDPVKNFPLAIASLREVMKKKERVNAILAGIDPAGSLFRGFLDEFPHRVLLLPVTEYPSAIMKRSHVLLMTSKREGSPLAILEAKALGIPSVGIRVGGILDTIHDRHDGILCEQTPVAIADAIGILVEDHALWSALSANALATAATWDLSTWAGQYMSVYNELLAV